MKQILMVVCILLLPGCSFFREQARLGCDELNLNTRAARELSECILETHLLWSGVARGAMLSDMEKLSAEAVNAWDELDLLALKYQEQGEFTDMELGMVLGYRVRLLREAVYEILKEVAPEALRYLPR